MLVLNKNHLNALIALAFIVCLSNCSESKFSYDPDFNFGWKFKKGNIKNAQLPDFNDSSWREIRLPHDWSVEASFTQEDAAGATAFLPGGVGWYRKTFFLPEKAAEKLTKIYFDGVYNNAEVWINGQSLGNRPYGYTAFYYDLSPHLNYGDKENVIAVKADRSAYVDCRWYPGSGIYRNVTLEITDKIHIKPWGTAITTSVINAEKALVKVNNTFMNAYQEDKSVNIRVAILDNTGLTVAEDYHNLTIAAGETKALLQEISITHPKLWDIDNPNLYSAKISVIQNGKVLDDYEENFGIRTIRYDANDGFFLNGKKTLFKGVCLHHDGGLVGAAVPDGVWERRLMRLKEAGCNAIRTAHNPPSEAFLDLCDRMGFLVQDEAFDEWDNPKDKRNNYNQQKAEEVTKGYTQHIKTWAEEDIKTMVRRDRNHPSIVMWSIGNEIEWTYPAYRAVGYWEEQNKSRGIDYYYDEPPYGQDAIKEKFSQMDTAKYKLATMAKNLSKWVKQEDTTRPVTGNLVIPSVSYFSGYTDALDIVGLSYRQSVYDYVRRLYPEKMILGTENWAQWHEWKAILDRDFVQGVFLWTGIFYMGESRNWPTKGSGSGILDFAGYRRASFHMFKSLWNEAPHLYMSTVKLNESMYELVSDSVLHKKRDEKYIPMWGWQKFNDHWNYMPNDTIIIETYTNCQTVELFLNDQSLGKQSLADNMDDHIIKWHVPFQSGKLLAKGIHKDGSEVSYVLNSAGEFKGISIVSDKSSLRPNGYDVAHIEVELVDALGVPFRIEEQEVEFKIEGDYRLLGVDNGASNNIQDIQSNKIITKNGRCLLIIQSNKTKSTITITAKVGEIISDPIKINVF